VHRRSVLGAAACLGVGAFGAEVRLAGPARIGLLGFGRPSGEPSQINAFRAGLRELGWTEGQNTLIEYRWAEDHLERLPTLVSELVQARVDVLLVTGSLGIRAARAVTHTVPVVFIVLVDPVTIGVAKSFAHPGGNMTGLASQFDVLVTKQLQLLREALPELSRVALLKYNGDTGNTATTMTAAEAAARGLGLQILSVGVNDVNEFEGAFRSARDGHAGAAQVLPSPFFDAHRVRLIELAAQYRLPAFYEFRNYVRDGGLMSYGPSIDEMFRRAASYVDRILRGADPGNLPIERPPKFEFVVNMKTAAALGLALPRSLLLQVDELIS